jgi:hypothetical protein
MSTNNKELIHLELNRTWGMRCRNGNCNGGLGFDIRGVLFCSPRCGNIYFNLKEGDEDYWSNDEQTRENRMKKVGRK